MEEDEGRRPLVLFGRDVTMIPCFRSSFLYGLGTGIVGGLATFMFTSKPRIATHVGVGSFVCSTWSYWMYCRWNWSKQRINAANLKALMEQHAAFEGTPTERELDARQSSLLVDA